MEFSQLKEPVIFRTEKPRRNKHFPRQEWVFLDFLQESGKTIYKM